MWNAARVLSDYIEAEPEHVRDQNVLELGAGAALPSIVAALNGARCESSINVASRSCRAHCMEGTTRAALDDMDRNR